MATALHPWACVALHGAWWGAYTQTWKRSIDGAFDGASTQEKARAVQDLIRACSSAATLVTLQPVPGLDYALITPIQHRMVEGIGRIHECRVDKNARREIFKTFRGKLIALNATSAGAKLVPFVPFVGDLIALSVAYALTAAIGELSDRYFSSGRTMSAADMTANFNVIYAERYERAYQQTRSEMKAIWRSPEVRRQLDELKKARRDGKVGEDELQRRTDALLNHR
jgi:uncharacterized protein (DUF697 family)